MICPNCSAEVKENSKFCTKCGKPVPKSSPKEAACPNIIENGVCRNTIRSDEAFCSECGWQIINKAFETGTYMCSAKGEKCKNLTSPEESFCDECGHPAKECTPKEEKSNISEDSNTQGNPSEEVVDSDISRSTISSSSTFSKPDVDRREQDDQKNEASETNSTGSSSPDVYPHSDVWTHNCQDKSKENTQDRHEENDNLKIRAENAEGTVKKDDENVNTDENVNSLPEGPQDDTKCEIPSKSEENKVPISSEHNEQPQDVDEKLVKEDSQIERSSEFQQDSAHCSSNETDKFCHPAVPCNDPGSTPEPPAKHLKIIGDDDKEDDENKNEIANEDESSNEKRSNESKSNYAVKAANGNDNTGPSADGTSVDSMPCEVNLLENKKVSGNSKKPKQGIERTHTMSTRSRSRQGNSCDITIEFHAIASKAFLTDPKCKLVGIQFNVDEMGGWGIVHQCDVIREIENDEGYEVFLRVTFPRHLLKTSFLEYRYCVMFHKAEHSNSEYFYSSSNRNNDDLTNTRRLFWKEKFGEIWQQYDGVVNAVPETTMLQWLWNDYENELLQNLKIYIRCCCPLIKHLNQNSNSTASEILQSLEMMFDGLKETYYYPLKYWKKKSSEDFRRHLNKGSRRDAYFP